MSYLVTGGAGFIGSHIAEALVKRGERVRIFDNLSTGRRDNIASFADDVELVIGDLRDAEQIAAAVEGVEVVFHQAALASVPLSVERPLDTHAACATGTLNLLWQAKQAGVDLDSKCMRTCECGTPWTHATSNKMETLLELLHPFRSSITRKLE